MAASRLRLVWKVLPVGKKLSNGTLLHPACAKEDAHKGTVPGLRR